MNTSVAFHAFAIKLFLKLVPVRLSINIENLFTKFLYDLYFMPRWFNPYVTGLGNRVPQFEN